MINAVRITLGDITYDRVVIALAHELEDLGLDSLFKSQTILFKHLGRWHACHNWNLTIIQVSKQRFGIQGAIPFDKIVINNDKIYGPGVFASEEVLKGCGIPNLWVGIERSVAFATSEGTFLTTDYAITHIQFAVGWPNMKIRSTGIQSASGKVEIDYYIKCGGARPCRSSRRRLL